jgi:diguanylate cyclase (GGDEF)-like protein
MSPLSFRVYESPSTVHVSDAQIADDRAHQDTAIERLHQDLDAADQELRRLRQASVRDTVTGGANMRALAMAWEGQELEDPCSMLVVDIDGFRRVNHSLGRCCGNAVLQAVNTSMERTLRWDDVVAREGADKFIVLLPLAIEEDAFAVAERLRTAIERMCFQVEQGRFKLTVRVGVASRRDEDTLETLVGRADKACRDGKTHGGNTIVFE